MSDERSAKNEERIYLLHHRRLKGKKCRFQEKISAENGTTGIFSLKILSWTTMPLKVGIIDTSKRLLID
jgi:hypothetical protein